MTTAEERIEAATRDEGGGVRVFLRPRAGAKERAQFRLTAAPGGYFVEEAIGGGLHYTPRAYGLTDSGVGADDIPPAIWAEREEMAREQAEAWAVLREHGIDLTSPLADHQGHADGDVRRAVRTLRGLQYLLVWPAEVVAEQIAAYQEQWAAKAT